MKKQKEKKMLTWKRNLIAALFCSIIGTYVYVSSAKASDNDIPEDVKETPSYANPAQAQHAANLAAAAAAQPDENVDEALSAVEEAEAALEEAEKGGIQEEIDAAREKLTIAEEVYADLIAEKIGVLSQEISAMRSTMGWGQIAHELGVHPGLLGLGHSKKAKGAFTAAEMDEVSEATDRNTRSGWSKGHGVGLNAGVENTGKTKGGYAFGPAKGSKGGKKSGQGGISGASGLSSSRGGSHGGGNGGGSEGGKGVAGTDGSPGNSGNGHGKGGNSGKGNKGGNSGNGKGGGKGK